MPTVIRQPSASFSIANSDQDVQNTAQRVLLVGQKTSAGSATAGALVENIASTEAPENGLFGIDSQMAEMVRSVKRVAPQIRVDAISLADTGVNRVLDLTVTAVPTETGSFTVTAGSEVQQKFTISVTSGDTVAVVASGIAEAVNNDLEGPFNAGNAAGVVTLTAVNAGTVANDLGVEVVNELGGITFTLSESTPGSTDPTLTAVLDVATERYQGIVWPYADDTSVLRTFLDARVNPTNEVLDGVGFTSAVDTHADHLTALGSLNTETLVRFCDETQSESLYLGPAQNEPSYSKSAMFAAIRAARLTPDINVSQFLTSSASLDNFGGVALASLPYFNTILPNLPTIKQGRGWTAIEIEQLFDAGGSVMGVNSGGDTALAGEVVTTYLTDAASNPDVTFTFLNYVDTASNIREYFFNNFKSRFGQSRLTTGAVSRGRDMANADTIRAFAEKLYQDLGGADFVLVESGEDAIKFFKENLTVTLDLSVGKATLTMLVPIVTQLRTIIATINITFSGS